MAAETEEDVEYLVLRVWTSWKMVAVFYSCPPIVYICGAGPQ